MHEQYFTRLFTGKRVPLLPWMAVCFVVGLVAETQWQLSGWTTIAAGTLCIVTGNIVHRRPLRFVCLALGFFLLGSGRMHGDNLRTDSVRQYFSSYIQQKQNVQLTCKVISFPQIRTRETQCRAKCVVKALSINGTETPSTKLLLYLYDNDTSSFPQFGDTIRCETTITQPARYRLNRSLTYDQYLERRAVLFVAKCKGKETFDVIARGWFSRWIHTLRQRLLAHLELGIADTDESALLQAMIFGEQPDVSRQLLDRFAALGIIHVLVISGLHVGCLAFITLALLRFVRMRRATATASMMMVVVFYLMLVGIRVSIVRAVIMILLYFMADFLHRERNPVNAVICAGWVQLLVLPNLIFDHGFHYSFLAVLGIVFFYPLCRDVLGRFRRYAVVRAVCITAIVWMCISPLTSYRNGVFMPFGVLLSSLYAGLTYCVVVNGMVAVIAGFVFPWCAQIVNLGNYALLKTMILGAEVVSGWRAGSFYFGSIPIGGLIGYYAVVGITLFCPIRAVWKLIVAAIAYASIIAYGIAYQG